MRKLSFFIAAAAMTVGSLFAADGIQVNKALTIGGHMDWSYKQVSIDTVAGAASADTATFAVEEAEIDIMLDLGQGLSARVDLVSNLGTGDTVTAEQALLNYKYENGANLTMGKFDTFIGLENLEKKEMDQYSNSLVWELEPTQHTGLCVSYDAGSFDLALAIVNGINPENPDINDAMAYALHVGFAPMDTLSLNLNYATADEGGGTGVATTTLTERPVTLTTLDACYDNEQLKIGFEYAVLAIETSATTEVEDTGMALSVNYKYSDRGAVTFRYSTVESSVTNSTTDGSKTEMTIAPSYMFTPNWKGTFEYRTESTDNAAISGTTTYAGAANGLATSDATSIVLSSTLDF